MCHDVGMYYSTLQTYKSEAFKRLSGVSQETFTLMLEALRGSLREFGRPPKLCLEDRLLMVLMYLREYRTMAHIAATYGVSEACVCRTIRRFETILIQDERFHLPGKKARHKTDTVFEVVLVDATECPCERPKKNNVATTAERRSDTHRKRNS